MKKKGPWKLIKSKIVYNNPWLEVREDKVVRPDGKPSIYGVVSLGFGVSVLPMDKEGNVYLTKEYHYAIERNTIEIVSGGVEEGESKLQAAKRELKEEAGLLAKKWTYLGPVDFLTNTIFSVSHMYLVQELTKVEDEKEGTETMEIIKVPFDEAIKWVEEGKITGAATIVLLSKVRDYLKITHGSH